MAQRTKRDSVITAPLSYQAVFHPEPEGGFTVLIPALPGCITYGKTLDEARKMAREAIEVFVEDMIADGEPVPEPDNAYFGTVQVDLPRASSLLHHA